MSENITNGVPVAPIESWRELEDRTTLLRAERTKRVNELIERLESFRAADPDVERAALEADLELDLAMVERVVGRTRRECDLSGYLQHIAALRANAWRASVLGRVPEVLAKIVALGESS